VELAENSVEQFYSVVLPETIAEFGEDAGSRAGAEFASLIVRLRLAKLPRVLGRALRSSGVPFAAITAVPMPSPEAETLKAAGRLTLTLFIADGEDLDSARVAATKILRRPPLSKFGIDVTLDAAYISAWRMPSNAHEWSSISLDTRAPAMFQPGPVPSPDSPLVLANIPASALQVS
jgi:hypothetical protein